MDVCFAETYVVEANVRTWADFGQLHQGGRFSLLK
jgi:hypothetical protein